MVSPQNGRPQHDEELSYGGEHAAEQERKAYRPRGFLRVTLSAYLRYERNQLEAAKALHNHPNTMRYRLGRIREVAGLTLDDEDELKYLRLSDWLSG